MPRKIRRLFAFAFLLLWLPAGALALTGQSISTFITYYKENIEYINDQQDRHLLPLELDIANQDNGGKQYSSNSDLLMVTVNTDASDVITSCELRLTYPKGAQPGNSLALDYDRANFHFVALTMAMHVAKDAISRAYLVAEILDNLTINHGIYERQYGSYTISCVSVAGEGAVFTFTNNSLTPALDDPWEGEPTPEPLDDSEHLG